MKNVFYYIVLVTIFLSCSEQKDYPNATLWSYEDFPETKELKGETFELDSIVLRPYMMAVYDSFLAIEALGEDHLFVVYNLNTRKKVGEHIRQGQGPEEMLAPLFVNRTDSVFIFDQMTANMFMYSKSDFLSENDIVSSQKIKFSVSPLFSTLGKVSNSYIASAYRAEALAYKFDSYGKKTGNFGSYPLLPSENFSDLEIVNVFRGSVTTNGTDRVAVCYNYTDLIDIYDAEGKLIKELYGPEQFYSKFVEFHEGDIVGSKGTPETFRDAFYVPLGTSEHFYVLYMGNYVRVPDYKFMGKHVFVFDWEGNPKTHYQLDQGVSYITVDETNRVIYGISDDPEYHLVSFKY
ncbi:MAG: BF3164 family lipoprotein [Parabacteroides sp.]|nr:BF3164 family lipoprotein [Parabacteroides sp.]